MVVTVVPIKVEQKLDAFALTRGFANAKRTRSTLHFSAKICKYVGVWGGNSDAYYLRFCPSLEVQMHLGLEGSEERL